MSKPPLKVADGEPVEPFVELVLVAGTELLTLDYYGVTLARPVRVRIPESAIASLDGDG